mgnify:CR=1 FL=1
MKQIIKIKYIVIGVVVALFLAFASISIYHVDTGEVALITQYGKIIRVEEAGLHLKSPLENRIYFNLCEQALSYGDQISNRDEIIGGKTAYTKD